jgi:hypothetical protein
MNIVKDPPKSYYTRRKDMVSDTQEITNMIGEFSGDRISEMIKVYPRGINPMVSVSYSNYGTNGGQSRGITNAGTWSGAGDGRSHYIGQAKLPIPLIDNGAFRPPIITQYDLLPLSRLPRGNTEAWTQPGFISYAEKSECPTSDKIRQIQQNTINYKVNPTATLTIGQLLDPPKNDLIRQVFEPIHYSADSRLRTRDITLRENSKNINGRINEKVLKGSIVLNKNAQRSVEYSVNDLNTKYYTSDHITYDVSSGKSYPMVSLPEGELHNNYTQNVLSGDIKTNKTSKRILKLDETYDGRTAIQDIINIKGKSGIRLYNANPLHNNDDYDYKLKKVIPKYSFDTPKSKNIQVINYDTPIFNNKFNDISQETVTRNNTMGGKDIYTNTSRNQKIKPTMDLSENQIHTTGVKPILYRENANIVLSKKQKLTKNKHVRFNI